VVFEVGAALPEATESSFAPLPLMLYPDVDIDEAGVKSESSSAFVLVGEVTPRFVVVESESDISDEAPEPVVCSPCLSFTG